MGKGKGLFLIIFGLGLATLFTLGAFIDVIFDLPWIDWRFFVAIPIWLIFVIISLILICVGVISFNKISMMERMFQSMFKDVEKTAEESGFEFETFIKKLFSKEKNEI